MVLGFISGRELCQSEHKSLSENLRLQVMKEDIRTAQETLLSYILPEFLTQGLILIYFNLFNSQYNFPKHTYVHTYIQSLNPSILFYFSFITPLSFP